LVISLSLYLELPFSTGFSVDYLTLHNGQITFLESAQVIQLALIGSVIYLNFKHVTELINDFIGNSSSSDSIT